MEVEAVEMCKRCGLRPIAPGHHITGRPVSRCAECRAEVRAKYSQEAQRKWSAKWQTANPEYSKQYYQANRAKAQEASKRWWRENMLRSRAMRYGLTLEAFKALVASQNGCCPICQRELVLKGKGGAQIDHEPGTERVRGILCRQCNVGLGMFGESPDTLMIAIRYLQTKT